MRPHPGRSASPSRRARTSCWREDWLRWPGGARGVLPGRAKQVGIVVDIAERGEAARCTASRSDIHRAARAASFSRINRAGDAVTRHGSYRRRAVALPRRPSTPHAPGDTHAPSITPNPHVIADFAQPRHCSSALIGRQNRPSGAPGQPGEHHASNPHHTQLLKSP